MALEKPLDYLVKRLWCELRPHRVLEAIRYALVRPKTDQRFFVVSAERNAGHNAIRCLESVYRQRYDRARVRHLFTDDASDDQTPRLIEGWLAAHPDHCVQFIRNEESKGAGWNSLRAVRMAPPGWIVVELDGDDWLPDPRVLAFLNKVYADPGVWMTYNTGMRYKNGRYRRPSAKWRPFPREVLESAGVRRHPHDSLGPLRTFRSELLRHFRDESMLDPDTGEFFRARDKALYFPLIELAGTHARHIYRVTYVYDISQRHKVTEVELASAQKVRSLQPYQPLESL